MLHVVLAFFGCRGGGLGALECDASVQSDGFLMRPVLSFRVESSKWHLFPLRLILNMLILQVFKHWFCFLSLSSSSLKYCQLTFPPKKKKRREKIIPFALFLNSTWQGQWSGSTQMNLLTIESIQRRQEICNSMQISFFFFIILTCFSKNSVLWGGCRCFPRAPL